MNLFLLYIWGQLGVLDFLEGVAFVLAICAAMFCGVAMLMTLDDKESDDYKMLALVLKRSLLVLGVVSLMSLVIPSQKVATILAGGWLTQQLATSAGAKEIGGKTYELILGKLNAELEKMAKEKK